MRLKLLSALSMLLLCADPLAARPNNQSDCSGVEHYPFAEAVVVLQNHGMVDDPDIDYARSRSRAIGSQRINRDLVRRAFLIELYLKSGKHIELMVINDESKDECSAGETMVFVVNELK